MSKDTAFSNFMQLLRGSGYPETGIATSDFHKMTSEEYNERDPALNDDVATTAAQDMRLVFTGKVIAVKSAMAAQRPFVPIGTLNMPLTGQMKLYLVMMSGHAQCSKSPQASPAWMVKPIDTCEVNAKGKVNIPTMVAQSFTVRAPPMPHGATVEDLQVVSLVPNMKAFTFLAPAPESDEQQPDDKVERILPAANKFLRLTRAFFDFELLPKRIVEKKKQEAVNAEGDDVVDDSFDWKAFSLQETNSAEDAKRVKHIMN